MSSKEIEIVSLVAIVDGQLMPNVKDLHHSFRNTKYPTRIQKPTPPLLETPRINSNNYINLINQQHTSGKRRF